MVPGTNSLNFCDSNPAFLAENAGRGACTTVLFRGDDTLVFKNGTGENGEAELVGVILPKLVEVSAAGGGDIAEEGDRTDWTYGGE